MNIQNTKIDLIQWLTTIEDKFIIQKIVEIRMKQTKNDWWHEISENERISIEKGISDLNHSTLISFHVVQYSL